MLSLYSHQRFRELTLLLLFINLCLSELVFIFDRMFGNPNCYFFLIFDGSVSIDATFMENLMKLNLFEGVCSHVDFNDVTILIVFLTRQLDGNLRLGFITEHNLEMRMPPPTTNPLKCKKICGNIFYSLIIFSSRFYPFFILTSDTPKHRSRAFLTAAELDRRVKKYSIIKIIMEYNNKLILALYPHERMLSHKSTNTSNFQQIVTPFCCKKKRKAEISEHRFPCHPK